jgi:DNA invertase Pin-like site-specific DNA recombinase
MNLPKCAAYLRISSDKQSRLAPEDQLRKCSEYAQAHGWEVVQQHIYRDEAVSAAGSDRPGLNRLLEAALAPQRQFSIVLVDDTSRLSRNLSDALRIIERLKFAGIRFVAASQNIDTEHEQADLMVGIHGIFDQLYLKELGQKTLRGLEGRALRGLHTGGRCFGYSTVPVEGGKKLQVNKTEAALVRRIFEMSASGLSLNTIAKRLNREGVPPPPPRADNRHVSWCPGTIQPMLRRETYLGRVTWNRTHYLKIPGSNKRVCRQRPRSEWFVMERPELRIITQKLWQRVQKRLAWMKQHFGGQYHEGLLNRAASSPHLLSGFLTCGSCGKRLMVVAGRGRNGRPKYGCPQNAFRGTCPNKLKERCDWLEKRLLGELQNAVLQPAAIDYAIQEFGRQLKASLANLTGELATMRDRKEKLESELRRLAAGVAEGGHSSFLLEAIAERERELREITARLLSEETGSVEAQVADIRQFITERLQNLPELLAGNVAQARVELGKHIGEIRMIPRQVDREWYYLATGQWNLLGDYEGGERNREFPELRSQLLARTC